MIRTIKIDVNAANPQLPLQPVSVFEGSAASLVLLNVPRSLGKRTITAVSVVVINPDSMAQAYEATREGSAYQVTIPAEAFGGSGSVENGIMVSASGTNERGETVDQWILGSGNLVVMQHSGTVKPGERRFAVHIYDAPPLHPVRGDMAPINGVYMLYNGIEWIGLGSGGSGSGAVVLRILDGKVYKGEEEITTFADLLAMVQAGGVTLLNTVGGNPKDALYYPHYCDDTGIRFDATGILGSAVQTRSIVMQPKSGGGIIITPGSLTELAKKTELTELSNKVGGKIDALATGSEAQFSSVVIAKNFHESAVDNQAIITGFSVPSGFVNSGMFNSIKIRGANSDSGVWDRVSKLRNVGEGHIPSVDSSPRTMPINAFATYSFSDVSSFRSREFEFLKENGNPASVRVALVSVDPSEGYSVKLSNGSTLTNFAPVFEFIGVENRRDFLDHSITRRSNLSAVKALASNASQSQIIAKINELIGLLK